ncbi:unnamed protein product, partial [Rangifer tarandus platyrhynchus]
MDKALPGQGPACLLDLICSLCPLPGLRDYWPFFQLPENFKPVPALYPAPPRPAPPQLLPAGCNPRVWGRAGGATSAGLKPGPAHNSRRLKCTGLRSLVPAGTSRCYQDALGVPALSFPSPVGGARGARRPRGRQRRHQAPPPPPLSLADITLNTCSLPPFSLQALARQPVNQRSGGSPPRRGSAMPGFATGGGGD